MKSLPQPSFLAYLDLVCCAMGAGLLLFLIAVSATPSTKLSTRDTQMLVVRCVYRGGSKLEVGIEMRRPGSADWVRSIGPEQIGFVAPTDEKSGAEAWVVLLAPVEGVWEFRPYLRANTKADTEGVRVELVAYGQRVVPQDEPKIQSLHKTGEFGNVLKVRVEAPPR